MVLSKGPALQYSKRKKGTGNGRKEPHSCCPTVPSKTLADLSTELFLLFILDLLPHRLHSIITLLPSCILHLPSCWNLLSRILQTMSMSSPAVKQETSMLVSAAWTRSSKLHNKTSRPLGLRTRKRRPQPSSEIAVVHVILQ